MLKCVLPGRSPSWHFSFRGSVPMGGNILALLRPILRLVPHRVFDWCPAYSLVGAPQTVLKFMRTCHYNVPSVRKFLNGLVTICPTGTNTPTVRPTVKPTRAPSMVPTTSPSWTPTKKPTYSPTPIPSTAQPSVSPTTATPTFAAGHTPIHAPCHKTHQAT